MTDGAWFHARVEGVSRGSGKSAVGLVAYVTGQKLKDEGTGNWCKRNHPGEVLAWGTEAPSHAPKYLTDPEQISRAWNDAQRAEKRINSHLANHENLALSANFKAKDHVAVMTEISRRMVERYGVMVTWSVHKPTDHGDDRNWHGHLAYNMRRITPDGFGEKVREIVAKETRSDERRWQRQMFADVINDRLAKLGFTERVSPLSYAERGIEKEPTKHLGNKQNQAELRGKRTPTGDHNRAARSRNAEHAAAQNQRAVTVRKLKLEAEVIDLLAERRRRAEKEMEMSEQQNGMRRREADGNMAQEIAGLKQAEDSQGRAEDFIRVNAQLSDRARADQQKLEEEARKRTASGDITDAKARYAQASTEFDIRRPYSSLCDVAAKENSIYHQQQDELSKQAAEEKDPMKRKLLLLRKEIEHADYMQITTERLAGISYVITGRKDKDSQYQKDVERAREWKEQGRVLREQRQDLEKERDERNMAQYSRGIAEFERNASGPIRSRRDLPQNQQPSRHEHHPERDDGREQSEKRINLNGREVPVRRQNEDDRKMRTDAKREISSSDERQMRLDAANQRQTSGGRSTGGASL